MYWNQTGTRNFDKDSMAELNYSGIRIKSTPPDRKKIVDFKQG